MELDSNFNLKWDAHQSTLKSIFDSLLDSESLSDCTIGAEGQHLKAHKLILSACSKYFEVLFSHHCGKHVVIILPGVKFHILKILMEFMYRGEVLVPQDELDILLELANFLQVKGLSHGDSIVSDKKDMQKRRSKSPTTSSCRASPETYKLCDSPELLEVPGSSSQSNCLQKQDYTKVTPISTPARKRKKSDLHSSREEPPCREDLVPGSSCQSNCLQKQDYTKVTPVSTPAHKHKKSDLHSSREEPPCREDLVAPSNTTFRNISLQRLEFPDKGNLAHGMLSDPKLRPSLRSHLSEFSEESINESAASAQDLISAKHLNSLVSTSVCETVSEDSTFLETFVKPKQEDYSGSNEESVQDVILDSADTQFRNTSVQSELTERSFCVGESFTQQMQFQPAEWSNTVPTEQTPASNDRFKCQFCDRSYRYHKGLARHWKYECGVEPQFQCPVCLVRFTHKHVLKMHMHRHSR